MTSLDSNEFKRSERDGLKTSIPSICASDRSEIEMDELEERVIQRIKHSPLAKLLASHKVPSASHKISDKEPKE